MNRQLAASPEAHPEELLALAWQHPKELLQNPLLPLLSVESPALWLQIITHISGGLREAALRDATPEQRQLLSQQIKQRLPSLSEELRLVKEVAYDSLWSVALRKTLEYQSLEGSFAELLCFSILGSSQLQLSTPERSLELALFETRIVGDERRLGPFYVLEGWLADGTNEGGCVEVEQVLEAVCGWLFDGLSWEVLGARLFNQELA